MKIGIAKQGPGNMGLGACSSHFCLEIIKNCLLCQKYSLWQQPLSTGSTECVLLQQKHQILSSESTQSQAGTNYYFSQIFLKK